MIAMEFASHLTNILQIQPPVLLTDCLTLASVIAARNFLHSAAPWNTRKNLANIFNLTSHMQAQIFHVSRNDNGVAHNLAKQVFQNSYGMLMECSHNSHTNAPCPVISSLQNIALSGFHIHKVYCF